MYFRKGGWQKSVIPCDIKFKVDLVELDLRIFIYLLPLEFIEKNSSQNFIKIYRKLFFCVYSSKTPAEKEVLKWSRI